LERVVAPLGSINIDREGKAYAKAHGRDGQNGWAEGMGRREGQKGLEATEEAREANSHDVAELEPLLDEGAVLVIAGIDGPPPPRVPGRIGRGQTLAERSPIVPETRTRAHQGTASTSARGHVPASHAAQHPERKRKVW
jgi:hypothetical protein